MEIVQDDLWLCTDCLLYAVNGDTSGIESDKREKEVVEGVNALGPNLVPDFDSDTQDGIEEFSRTPCDACGTRLAGERHRFAILGEKNPVAFGFDGTELALVAGGVGILGIIGYLVWKSSQPQAPAISVASSNSPAPVPVPVASTGLAPGYYWEDQGNTQTPAFASSIKAIAMSPDDVATAVYGTVIVPISPGGNTTFGVTASDAGPGVSFAQIITLPLSYVTAA